MFRKILRNKARAKMIAEGMTQLHKRPLVMNPESHMWEKADSKFSKHWREYA